MARTATTSDVFNAIAEPQRRQILMLLRTGERPVTELAQELRMSQRGGRPNICGCSGRSAGEGPPGRQATAVRLDARGLRPVHEWTGGFERFWNESFDRLDEYVRELEQERQED